jgi:hypothetical protein
MPSTEDVPMHDTKFYAPLKLVSLAILIVMVVTIGYAAFISLKYWSGIGV